MSHEIDATDLAQVSCAAAFACFSIHRPLHTILAGSGIALSAAAAIRSERADLSSISFRLLSTALLGFAMREFVVNSIHLHEAVKLRSPWEVIRSTRWLSIAAGLTLPLAWECRNLSKGWWKGEYRQHLKELANLLDNQLDDDSRERWNTLRTGQLSQSQEELILYLADKGDTRLFLDYFPLMSEPQKKSLISRCEALQKLEIAQKFKNEPQVEARERLDAIDFSKWTQANLENLNIVETTRLLGQAFRDYAALKRDHQGFKDWRKENLNFGTDLERARNTQKADPRRPLIETYVSFLSDTDTHNQAIVLMARLFYVSMWMGLTYSIWSTGKKRFVAGMCLGVAERLIFQKELEGKKLAEFGEPMGWVLFLEDLQKEWLGGGRSVRMRSKNFGERSILAQVRIFASENVIAGLYSLPYVIDVSGLPAGRAFVHTLWESGAERYRYFHW